LTKRLVGYRVNERKKKSRDVMLNPRNGFGLEAKNYGLGLGLVASGLGLSLIDAVASASTVWPRSLIVL